MSTEAKKSVKLTKAEKRIDKKIERSLTVNPLMNALRANDESNLFSTNVTTVFHKTGFHLFDYYFGSVVNIHNEIGEIIRQDPRVGQASGTFNMIVGNSGSGKAQPVTTKIPTPDGYKLMGDLKVGDMVFGSDGKPTEVEGIYPQGLKTILEVEFDDGRTALCCTDHLWDVTYMENGEKVSSVLPLSDIISDYKLMDSESEKLYNKGVIGHEDCAFDYKYTIKTLQNHVRYNHKPVPIDPYTLGLLINVGCFEDEYLSVITSDETIIGGILERCYNIEVSKDPNVMNKYYFNDIDTLERITTSSFLSDLPEFINCNSIDKFIPDIYLYNSYDTRMELLRGLLHLDGNTSFAYINEYNNGKHLTYSPPSKTVSMQFQNLVRSLGCNTTSLETAPCEQLDYKHSTHITIWCLNRFINNLYRSIELLNEDLTTYPSSAKIVDIRIHNTNESIYDCRQEAVCIKVSAEDHLYLTEDFVITHNTTLVVQIAAGIARQYEFSDIHHYDCEQRFDISRGEVISQLPAWWFEDGTNQRYIIRSGTVSLEDIQEAIVKIYINKLKLRKELTVNTGMKNEFNKDIHIIQPTVVIIDSITTVINNTFNVENKKESNKAGQLRSNTEGARDAKSLKGFFKDILPLCKEANIIIYAVNHLNVNMSMNAFIPVARQQNYLRQDEIIPGGKTMIFYPFNIIKLVAKPGDDFTEESDGFAGNVILVEPIKSSSNQSGNNSKGVSFELVFTYKYGFDSLRSLIAYARSKGIIEGNKNRLKFKGEDFTFSTKTLMEDKDTKPIWESLKKYVFPELLTHLSFVEPNQVKFDDRSMDY